jgi:aldose sugar dehydrogenase
VWGFRDALIAGESMFLSDAVIDTGRECVRMDVHEISVSDLLAGTTGTRVIYSSTPCLDYTQSGRVAAPIKTHLAGALAYDAPTDQLFVTIGDYHLGASTIGQAVATGIAVTERDYALLRDPDAAASAVVAIATPRSTPSARIFAKGLRNSLGLVITPKGDLWLSDHGPNGGDELNLIIEGADYGWPLRAQGRPYNRSAWPSDSNQLPAPWLDFFNADLPGATDPQFVWTPAIAPSELAFYSPLTLQFPQYQGAVLLGSLRGEALIALTLDQPIQENRLQLGERIRDVTVMSNGTVALLTDSSRLLLLSAPEG